LCYYPEDSRITSSCLGTVKLLPAQAQKARKAREIGRYTSFQNSYKKN
jgi:hypothetical protein